MRVECEFCSCSCPAGAIIVRGEEDGEDGSDKRDLAEIDGDVSQISGVWSVDCWLSVK